MLAIAYRFLGAAENRKRDKDGIEAFEHAYEDDLTDRKNKQFRSVSSRVDVPEYSGPLLTPSCRDHRYTL